MTCVYNPEFYSRIGLPGLLGGVEEHPIMFAWSNFGMDAT